jgi:archaeosine synthase
MNYFFELLTKSVGFSRIGRIICSKETKKFISTPNIIVPMKKSLMNNVSFLEEFEDHEIFLILKDFYLKIEFLRDKFKQTGFIYTHNGSMETFKEKLASNVDIFQEDNVIPSIPFNIATTAINKEFAVEEINNFISESNEILKKYNDLDFGLSIKIYDYYELFDLYIPLIKNNENVRILNLVDLFDNFNKFRQILRVIFKIKKELDNNLVLMASGRIIPKYYPILIYLGIDLIDCSYLLYLSTENFYDTIEYLLPIYKIRYFPCSCVICKRSLKYNFTDKYSSEKLEQLTLHNIISAHTYMHKIKLYMRMEDFRGFIEKSTFDDVNIISTLRVLDKKYFNVLRFENPITQKSKIIKSFGPSSYYRPDFQEFRDRVIKNFTPELWTKLIILLPCSAKKPYSESKSHRKFQSVIRKFPDFPDFQEIIITSPLGAIPRQLENIYPVNSYDISVTGEWNKEEIEIASNMLISLLKKYDERIPVLCHLKDSGYLEVVDETKKQLNHKFYFSAIEGNLTTKDSLLSFERKIKSLKESSGIELNIPEEKNFLKTWTRKFIKIIDYQFGPKMGSTIFLNGIKTWKNKNNNQIEIIDQKNRKKLGNFNSKSGQIELSLVGANRLLPFEDKKNIIVFDGQNIKGNTLFRPGVISFSQSLVPKDIVLIFNKQEDKLIGLGNLIVGSNYIKNSKTGKILNVYEKI